MKKLVYYASAGLMCLAAFTAPAQIPDTSVINNFPPGVSMFVLKVLQAVPINVDQQISIAGLYDSQEKYIADANARNASQAEIMQIRSDVWQLLQTVFKSDEYSRYIAYYQAHNAKKDTNTTAEFQSEYFKNKVSKLDSIKALAKKIKTNLFHDFDSLCKQRQGMKLDQVFLNAMYITPVTDTAYYGFLVRDDITATTYINAQYYTNWYKKNVRISDTCQSKLYSAYFEKERKLATLKYSGLTLSKAMQKMYTKTTAYYDSLVYRLLVFDGKANPDTTLYTLVTNKSYFKLTASQLNKINEKAVELYHLRLKQAQKDPDKVYNNGKFVRPALQTILNDDQYDQMLLVNNKERAAIDALQAWKNMKADSLTKWLDSARVTGEINRYLLTSYMTRDYFLDNKSAQKAHLKALEAHAPYHLRRLHARRKKEAMAKGGNYRGTFLW